MCNVDPLSNFSQSFDLSVAPNEIQVRRPVCFALGLRDSS
jgi:hypothetical protein